MISFGAIYGGPSKANMDFIFSPLMASLEEERKEYPKEPLVNIVFHFPGELDSVDFEGVRTIKVDTKDQKCLVAASVPEEITNSTDEITIRSYLKETIAKALFLAEKRLGKVNIHINSEQYNAFFNETLNKIS